jgi:ribosomal protein S18 acetylase RimI-like enzyme
MASVRQGGGIVGLFARPAVRADLPAISAMLARAFLEDPVMVFMFPEEADRRRKLPRLFTLLLTSSLPLGGCDVLAGAEAATLWRPPGREGIPFWEILLHIQSFLGIYGFRGTGRALTLLGAMDKHHPREPHWYLMVIGTEPALQGKGCGGAVLRHRLSRIDAQHLPAYLEASKPENVSIYRRFGFEQRAELQIPGGPVIFPMWRPPR